MNCQFKFTLERKQEGSMERTFKSLCCVEGSLERVFKLLCCVEGSVERVYKLLCCVEGSAERVFKSLCCVVHFVIQNYCMGCIMESS